MSVTTKLVIDLPSETLICILHLCDYKTIIRFSLACKRSHRIVCHSTSLQLHIELEINGLEIVDRSSTAGASYASILEELKGYQNVSPHHSFSLLRIRMLAISIQCFTTACILQDC
ncbi:hypothetical protein B0J17DRAFT_116983 [Rhizoctonia solani]|nr:hypothetical protein B0J17DRAFT_116983 [Rhizoctonia solani]